MGSVGVSQQLDENCTVSILNRTAQVRPDGTWRIDNVPANFDRARVRVTCVKDGVTTSGQSDFITFEPRIANGFSPVLLAGAEAIPATLSLSNPTNPLTQQGQTVQLTATATFPNGSTSNATSNEGINFLSSNSGIVSVSSTGVITANMSGTAIVSARLEGALAVIQVRVAFSGDTDGDGIPDDVEVANGLNPDNPVDGLQDPDGDGLTDKQELVDFGTNRLLADSDRDGISDGEEVVAGVDGFITNPLLADTDGDGIRDALEIATNSDPTNSSSVNLAAAVQRFEVTPETVVMIVNTITSEASRQLTVTARLIDGTDADFTRTSRGTNYSSSDLTIVNFGTPDGRIFAGNNGNATVTVTNGPFSATVPVTVTSFAPTPLGFVAIPGYANDVDVAGDDYAYVAAGSAGLQVVDVRNPAAPVIVGSVDTPGNANDVRVVGGFAYVADGVSGLQVINISNPALPVIVGSLDTPGVAQDLWIANGLAYIADGAVGGLRIVDIASPANPFAVGNVDTPGNARGVAVTGTTAVVADESPFQGIRVINAADPAAPAVVGSLAMSGGPKDLDVEGNFAYVAAFTGGFNVVDFSNRANPAVVGSIPGSGSGFVSRDVEVSDQFALAAEQLFATFVSPIVDISVPSNPIFRANLAFPTPTFGDFAGTGIALTREFAYLTAESFVVGPEFGTSGTTRLFIGQYRRIEDTAGIAPAVAIVSPTAATPVIAGDTVTVTVDATDDVGVAAVDLLVNGALIGTDSAEPYQFTVTLPAALGVTNLQARARDFGGNAGQSATVQLQVVPDPLTTVVGSVVDESGNPVGGARVAIYDEFETLSASDGTFFITAVPTIRGAIRASVSAVVGDAELSGGSTGVAPVRGGTTNIGAIALVPAFYELDRGVLLAACDDCFQRVDLPFTFRYFGRDYTSLFMDGNGRLTFNSGSGDFTESVAEFDDQPNIAVFWDDIDAAGVPEGGFFFNSSLPGRVVFTWYELKQFGQSASQRNNAQIILFADGRIQFGYQGITAPDAIIGLSAGPGFPIQAVAFSDITTTSFPNATTVYEQFSSGFDLDHNFLIWTPNLTGGYDLRRIGDIVSTGAQVVAYGLLDVSRIEATPPLSTGEVRFLMSNDSPLGREFELLHGGLPEERYRLERSEDLNLWEQVGASFGGSPGSRLLIRERPGLPKCFFRVTEE